MKQQHADGELPQMQPGSGLGSGDRMHSILDTMPQIVWSARPDGYHDFYNARWYDYTGVAQGSTDGEGWNDLFHPDDQEMAWERWRHSLATGDPYEIEYRLRRKDGRYRWMLGRAVPIHDATGQLERWFGTCTDIDDMKTVEEQRDMVARELAHRIRNIFAVVNSLLVLSSRNRPEAVGFVEGARSRIESLARAHDYIHPALLAAAPAAATATIIGLTRTLLQPYGDVEQDRIAIEGDDVAIGTAAATSLALVLHELATNAIKHGALSAKTGKLRVWVSVDGEWATLTWMEREGPLIPAVPEHRGFGTTLSERALRTPLGGSIERAWDRDGLTAGIRIPLNRLGL